MEHLRCYLDKWRDMAGCESSQEGLETLILRDQFFTTYDKDLRTFLKEKEKLSLKEMTQAAGHYIDDHEYQYDDKTSKPKQHDKTNGQHGVNNDSVTQKKYCEICKHTNYNTDQCRQKSESVNRSSASSNACFYCKKED